VIQRFIFTALQDGLAQMQSDHGLVDDLFREVYELEGAEVAAIIEVFGKKPPHVIHGYLRSDTRVPVYSIVLGNENETEKWLHDDSGIIDEPEDESFGADILSSIWQHHYNILTYTDHPDLTAYYYEIAKSILLASNAYFTERDLYDIDISGADLPPDPKYLPEHLFVRQMMFRCNREFRRIDRSSRFGRAFKVRGIHVDRSGSPSDVGDVATNVTIDGGDDGEDASQG
jgi:hypothetical protein